MVQCLYHLKGSKMKKFFTVFSLLVTHSALAQTFIDQTPSLFQQQDLNVAGRIRQLTTEQVFSGKEKEIVLMARDGEFPNWKGELSFWRFSKTSKKIEKVAEWHMPKESILYGFIPNENQDSYLILVLPNKVQIGRWSQNQWVFDAAMSASIRSFSEISYGSLAQPFDPMVNMKGQPGWFWVPTLDGYQMFAIEKGKLVTKSLIPLKPKSFYQSSHDLLPFEFQFWFRNVYWFPNVVAGETASGSKSVFYSPWMDEMSIIDYSPGSMVEKKHYFKLLSEKERDDGIHYIVNRPVDFNGDGQTDFLVNKFMGTGTAFRSKNYYYMTSKEGVIPAVGKPIKTDGNKASGALVEDVDRDGKQDFVIVSTSFTPWSMVRAITRRQVLLEFDFYKFKEESKPYNFSRADLHQEVLFDFNLGDVFVDGILPTLEGDFNGDGFPDVFYARNREGLSFMIQNPKGTPLYPAQPTAVHPFKVPRKYRIGDLDGDGKSDLVFFNTREDKNRSFTVLTNQGLMK
jgi:hypothetical protein